MRIVALLVLFCLPSFATDAPGKLTYIEDFCAGNGYMAQLCTYEIPVIKVKFWLKNNPGQKTAWQREANLNRNIADPNLLEFIDAGYNSTEAYLLFQFYPTTSLVDKIKEQGRPYNEIEARMVAKELVTSLARIHKKGSAHGAIKPENILYTAKNELKLSSN